MLNIGPQELILVLIVALLVVGPQRLPELSRQIGRGLREFRKLQDDVKGIVDLDEVKREVKGMVTFDDATETRRPSSNATAAPSVHRAPRPVSSPAAAEEQPALEAEPQPPGSDRSADAD
jgi:sec-independent protein translocase protein TatB